MSTNNSIEDLYELICQVGEGTYGKVYKARCRKTGRLVALKKIRMESEKEGFPVTAAREIKLLKSMNHENIVQLEQICASSMESVCLVFEYLEFDLAGLQHPLHFNLSQIKFIIREILKALEYLHEHGVLHRDIKGSNVLLSRKGHVKLADFGLAKCLHQPDLPPQEGNRMMTNRVITLWYRPPEILLGTTQYGPEVDIWGVGCILLELIAGKPIFTGQDELSQLQAICNRLGPLPETILAHLPWFNMIKEDASMVLEATVRLEVEFAPQLGQDGMDLLMKMLSLDPTLRTSAKEALSHPWFNNDDPFPCNPSELLSPAIKGDWHEFESKQRRKKSPLINKSSLPLLYIQEI